MKTLTGETFAVALCVAVFAERKSGNGARFDRPKLKTKTYP
jgi:hypothetical protein